MFISTQVVEGNSYQYKLIGKGNCRYGQNYAYVNYKLKDIYFEDDNIDVRI